MKVLLITNLFPTPSDPERGVFTLQLTKELGKLCDLTIVCPLPWFPKIRLLKKFKRWYQLAEVPKQYDIDGVSVYSPKYLLIPKLSESLHALFMFMGIKTFIKMLHNKMDFDVINSQWLYPDSVASESLAKEFNLPHVATGLGCDINDHLLHLSKARKILSMMESSDGVTVVSSRLKEELMRHNVDADKINVILNGVDYERFKLLDRDECRRNIGFDVNDQLVLYVGRLSDEKCVDTLIKAFDLMRLENSSLKLALVGNGSEYQALKELSNKLCISEYIHFVGKIGHDDINQWYCAADVFCLPSKREGCPNVVLESLASGCPVVASDVGAVPDLVSVSTGLLFEPENVEDISDKLTQAISKEWNRVAIRESMEKSTWSQAAHCYIDAFTSAINKHK